MGVALRASYGGDEDDPLDDRLVALMLELSVEPEERLQVQIQAWRR